MFLLLVLFSFIIGAYNYLTDSRRVRAMAEESLSNVIGGKVEVQSATLSIFEGLRLDGVKVYVDRQGNYAPDSLIFSAQSFVLQYDPRTLLAGQIDASQIIAQKPHVYLTESLDQPGHWNFYRLGHEQHLPAQVRPQKGPHPIPLPEVLLRNAQVDISEVRGDQKRPVGFMAIDGQLTPTGQGNRYHFQMQARGDEGVGPYASGTIALNTQDVSAELHNFDFSRDLRSMLPAEVRNWWLRHALGGQIEKLDLEYSPGHDGNKPSFSVDMELGGVTISVPPEDWMGADEIRQLRQKHQTVSLMQGMYVAAGFGTREEEEEKPGASSRQPEETLATRNLQLATDAPSDDDIQHSAFSIPRSPLNPEPRAPNPPAPLQQLSDIVAPPPIRLKEGRGHFHFDGDGIHLTNVMGQVEGNWISINGHIDGYVPDAPASLMISSLPGKDIYIPPNPRWANSLPKFVRDIYQDIRPTGHARLVLDLERSVPGAVPAVSGKVDITAGEFCYRKFPYPMRDASGTIMFGRDADRGGDMVRIMNFRGKGIPGGPNANFDIVANGEIGPLGRDEPEVKVVVTGRGISSEPALSAAYPWEISHAISIFDADKTGIFPQYRGSFQLTLVHHAGTRKWTFDTDVDIDDSSGKIVGFPYPLRHVKGKLQIRDGYLDILNATMHDGPVDMSVNGRVVWAEGHDKNFRQWDQPGSESVIGRVAKLALAESPTKIDLNVHASGLPIDQNLIAAIPPDHASWIKTLGLGGTLNVDGRIYQGIAPDLSLVGPATLAFPGLEPRRTDVDPERIDFDLGIGLHHGSLWPADGTFSVSDLSGKLRLSREGMEIFELRAKRDKSSLTADGNIQWDQGAPRMLIHATAKDLLMDASLYGLLPDDARKAWDEVQPHGVLDADMTWGGNVAASTAAQIDQTARAGVNSNIAGAVASADDAPMLPQATQPQDRVGFRAILKPRQMSCTVRSLPYRLEQMTGTIVIDHNHVTLTDIKAHHGEAELLINGAGNLAGARPLWNIRLAGKSIPVDQEFRNAVPATIQSLIDSLKLRGTVDLDFPHLVYRGEEAGTDTRASAASVPSALTPLVPSPPHSTLGSTGLTAGSTQRSPQSSVLSPLSSPPPGADMDLTSLITLHDGSLDAGVPLDGIEGQIRLETSVRDGNLAQLDGNLKFDHLKMAGRRVTDLSADLKKPLNSIEMTLDKIQARVAGGQMVGQLKVYIPDEGSSRYTLGLVLRNADVKTLAGDAEKDIRGQLTASVSLEGTWGDGAMRRGRGDVTIAGRELYRMPLILGLLQVTNLSLPIGSPFNQGLARYSVDGQRVNFERIELKSDTMMMIGTGHLDFAKKQVQMTFTTDNPGGFKIPFFNDIWQGARQELFKITIKGSIQQPKVEANPFGTFTTTIDEVFKGDARK